MKNHFMLKIKKIDYNTYKKVIGIILGFIVNISLYKLNYISDTYSMFNIVILALFYIFFMKSNLLILNNNKKYIFTCAFILSLLYIVGYNINMFMYDFSVDILSKTFSFNNLLPFLGVFIIIVLMLNYIFDFYLNYKMSENNKNKFNNKKLFLLSIFLIFVSWLPYFLNYYPGSLSSDSTDQLAQVFGIYDLSDFHPITHTLLVNMIVKPITILTDNINFGVASYVVAQMIILATILSYLVLILNKTGINKTIITLVLLYFMFSPIFGFYSITVWKDVLFGGFFLLFCINIFNMINNENIMKNKNYFIFCIISLLLILFRNNAIYIYIFVIPFFVFFFKKIRKKIVLCFVIVLFIFSLIKYPIFNMYNIKKSSTSEYLAMPIQQIGRMTVKNINFTREEEEMLEKIIPLDIVKEVYNPYASDKIKFNSKFSIDIFDNNKIEYLKLYIKLLLKYPSISIESYLTSTIGYWFPDYQNAAITTDVYSEQTNKIMKITRNSLLKNKLDKYFAIIESRDNIIMSMQWSIGLCFWFVCISSFILFKKNKQYLLIFTPILGLWLTMMVASPVQGEFRYVFGVFCTLPLIMVLPMINRKRHLK